MLAIPCPWCGMRPENEFRYAGPAHVVRPANPYAADDATWINYLFLRDNPKGRHEELWRHLHGCGRFFNCVRDTSTDRIATSHRLGEVPQS
jgi:sarcosine oxidase, subunit delta